MRDCIFLVADSNMRACIEGFLGRDAYDKRLGTGPFRFDPTQDLIVDEGGSDPGVYRRAHELLKSYRATHSHAVVILDNQWDGSPGAAKIAADVRKNLVQSGWQDTAVAVIVIEPELEAWFWQDSPHVERALGYAGAGSLRDAFAKDGSWPANRPKPLDPKGLMEAVLRQSRRPRSSSLYRQVAASVSVKSCEDPGFQHLQRALHAWFPVEAAL